MKAKKSKSNETGSVELAEKDLRDIDLDEVRAGLTLQKAVIDSMNFKDDGRKTSTKVAGTAEGWVGAGAEAK